MFNIHKAHYILDEMVSNGCVVDANKSSVLKPLNLLDQVSWLRHMMFWFFY